MLVALTIVSYVLGTFMLLFGVLARRFRSMNGPQVGRLSDAAAELGASGAITREGGRITFGGRDRVFSLSGSDYGKRQPRLFHLGTTIRRGQRIASVGSAFRDADREPVLPRLPHVVLREEGAVSGLTKRLRLNREIETGDRAFDEAVYVEHDGDRALVSRLVADPRLRAAVTAALATRAAVVFNEEEHAVALRWVGGTEPRDATSLNEAAQALAAIADLAPAFEDDTLRPRTAQWKRGVTAVAPVLLSTPCLVLGMLAHQKFGPVSRGFTTSTLLVTACALAVVLGIGWVLARGRVGALFRFYVAANLGVVALPTLIGSALAIANGAGIEAREVRSTQVLSTYQTTRKRTTTCRAKLAPWADGVSAPEAVFDCARIQRVKRGHLAKVTVGVGRLGWEWVESTTIPGSTT